MPTDSNNNDQPKSEAPSSAFILSHRVPGPPPRQLFPSVLSAVKLPIGVEKKRVRYLNHLAAAPARRRRTALVTAVLINIVVLGILAIFGKVQIFVPNRPADSISVVLVDLPQDPPVPELRDPEIEQDPEPEPEEIEVIDEPDLIPDPEPVPVPEPEEVVPEPDPEPEPEEPEQAPEPEPEPEEPVFEPVFDLTPEPVFAPPSEDEAPFIPDPAAEPSPEPLLPDPSIEDLLPGDVFVDGDQTPADEADPLTTPEPENSGGEEAEAIEEQPGGDPEDDETQLEEEELGVGERVVEDIVEEIPGEEEAAEELTGDDIFDQDPIFGGSRFALPRVELPQGETTGAPGESGVVAIFCPEEFDNDDKAAECAGRTQIRSGWRPGASGESWDEAIRLLKKQREDGVFNDENTAIFGPELAREAERRRRQEDLQDFRQSQNGLNNQADELNRLGQTPGDVDLGPPEFTPAWTLREDPDLSQRDLDKLENDLEEAARAREE